MRRIVSTAPRVRGSWGGEEEGDPLPVADSAHQRDHALRRLTIEVGGRFVGEHELRACGQGAGDRHPLFLPAGELVRPLVRLVRHVHRGEKLRHPRPALLRRPGLHHDERVGDVLCRRSTRIRLKSWHTKPIRSARKRSASGRESRPMSSPSTVKRPSEGRSRAPIMLRREVLPDPEGPTRAAKRRLAREKVTPRRAVTSNSPAR